MAVRTTPTTNVEPSPETLGAASDEWLMEEDNARQEACGSPHSFERSVSKDSGDSELEAKDKEIIRMNSKDLADMVQKYKALQAKEKQEERRRSSSGNRIGFKRKRKDKSEPNRSLLVSPDMIEDGYDHEGIGRANSKTGAFAGVFIPTCECMWGALIFLRFSFIVGHAGVAHALAAVFLSFSVAFCTTSSMSAIASSGGLMSEGGPYFMISRALGPAVGASVGIIYWLAITMLSVLEVLGAVETILIVLPDVEIPWCKQIYGSALMLVLTMCVRAGLNLATRAGHLFVFIVVFSSIVLYYLGIFMAPWTDAAKENLWVTGLNPDTLRENWNSHYLDDVSFGMVLSLSFPCFTGVLSGAHKADRLRDPPKNIRQGTFGAVIFSVFMYSSFLVLWGLVANYRYLRGDTYSNDHHQRFPCLAPGDRITEEIVLNPFPQSALVGIIASSLGKALQCLIIASCLLQSISKDRILRILDCFAPLSKKGEPVNALWGTYFLAAMSVLLGELNTAAPLLSMCFLVAYSFMNISCFSLTWLNSTAFRPKGIQKKRWRFWYMGTGGCGFAICLTLMFIINPWLAVGALIFATCLYLCINWALEAKEWGSAMDGIRFHLALKSLIQMEEHQNYKVNWRPQVLILYRIHLSEELKGIQHHEILRLYTHLRKANGFCVVACVLEADQKDEHAIHKAGIEKGIIKSIMKEESIQGFAEVVVAPSWVEGTNYIIQLTGLGGLSPNTVLLDWPDNWRNHRSKARDFVSVLRTSLAGDKAVIAMKGAQDLPISPVYGTIDIWWMIHDGGFLILLSWLLVQHRVWRTCHLRIFTITEGVSETKANEAAQRLTKTLRERRLFDVDVEVILADEEMLQPYTHDWTLRVEDRHRFLESLHHNKAPQQAGASGLDLDDLFRTERSSGGEDDAADLDVIHEEDERRGHVTVSSVKLRRRSSDSSSVSRTDLVEDPNIARKDASKLLSGLIGTDQARSAVEEEDLSESGQALNQIVYARSKRAQLVVMNLPDLKEEDDHHSDYALRFISYCDTLTRGLERVLYVHSTGHEIFDISA